MDYVKRAVADDGRHPERRGVPAAAGVSAGRLGARSALDGSRPSRPGCGDGASCDDERISRGGARAVTGSAELRLGVLTNSTTDAADRALTVPGLSDRLQVVIGPDEVQTFKPHPRVHEHAVQRLATEPGDVGLVPAHGWDGAMRVRLRTAWVARSENWLVPIVTEPDVMGAAIPPRALAAGAKLAREPGDLSCAR